MYNFKYMNANKYTEEFIKDANKSHFEAKHLDCFSYNNAVILPWRIGKEWGYGGVLDSDLSFIKISENKGGENKSTRFGGSYEFDSDSIEYVNDKCIYIGPIRNHWGHILVDCCSRVWACNKKEFESYKVAYLIDNGTIEEKYICFFELLGIKRERLCAVKNPQGFSEVVIPEQSYIPGTSWTKEYKLTMESVLANLEKLCIAKHTDLDKIYISRTHWKVRDIYGEYGEKVLQKLFEINGYYTIYPEELEIPELLHIISHAKSIVTSMGTNAHAVALFAQNADDVIILNKRFLHVKHQVVLNELFDKEIIYIDTYFSYTLGIYLMGITKNVLRYCQDKHLKRLNPVFVGLSFVSSLVGYHVKVHWYPQIKNGKGMIKK